MRRAARQVAAVVGVLAALLAGAWLWGSVVAPGYWSAIGLVSAWFLVIGTVTTRLGRRVPAIRLALRGTYFAAAALTVVAALLTSVRTTTVDEQLETGVPASRLDTPAGRPGAEPAPAVDDLLAPQP